MVSIPTNKAVSSICLNPIELPIVLTWTPFQDAIRLRPNESFLADDYDTLEHTGSAEKFPSMFEEGNENGMLSRLIQNQTLDNTSKETPTIVEDQEDQEEEYTPQSFDDSSDDSSTELDREEQGYIKPLQKSSSRELTSFSSP